MRRADAMLIAERVTGFTQDAPEPVWTAEDAAEAHAEGWALLPILEDASDLSLEHLEGSGWDDLAAVLHVVTLAVQDENSLHYRALEYWKTTSQERYASTVRLLLNLLP